MYRFLIILTMSLFCATPLLAQEAADEIAAADASEELAAALEEQLEEPVELEEPEQPIEPEEPEVIDETGLDEQGFTDEDDDFDPTEDIPADQSIDFPTDI